MLSQNYPDLDFSREILVAYYQEKLFPKFSHPELIDYESLKAPIFLYGAICDEHKIVVTWSYSNTTQIETWIPVDFWISHQEFLQETRNQLIEDTDTERIQNIEMSVAA